MAKHSAQTPDLGAAARALTEAASALSKALGESFHEIKPQISLAVATGLREAADSVGEATTEVKARAKSFDSGRRAHRSAETREGLLVAAASVIASKGYQAATVEDIASAAGYTKGAVYTHFATKRDLFAALAIVHLGARQPLPKEGKLAEEIAASLRRMTEPSCVLLTLEVLILAIRDTEFREQVGPAWIDALDVVAHQVAAHRGATTPTMTDRDTAIGLTAIINTARTLAFVALPGQAEPEATEVTVRLVKRLLDGSA